MFPDSQTFKELLKDHTSGDVAFVNEKWMKYGKSFLQVCINAKLAPVQTSRYGDYFYFSFTIILIISFSAAQKALNVRFDVAGMREQFGYQEPGVPASKTFKFTKPTESIG